MTNPLEQISAVLESFATSQEKLFHIVDIVRASQGYVCVPGWQPIETAPKSGEVLLMVELRAGIPGRCLVGHYMPGGYCIEDHPLIDGGWYFWNGCMFDKASKPISWMPLVPTLAASKETNRE